VRAVKLRSSARAAGINLSPVNAPSISRRRTRSETPSPTATQLQYVQRLSKRPSVNPPTVRRFVYLLWCSKGRLVYRASEGGGVGPDLAPFSWAKRCHLSGKTADFTPRTKRELYATLSMPSFQDHRRIKIIFVVTYISSARRAASFRCRYTNRLNSANNRGVRNVPLPVGRVSVRRQSAMTSSADHRSVLPVHHTIWIYILGEVTSHNLWSRYDRHFVSIYVTMCGVEGRRFILLYK